MNLDQMKDCLSNYFIEIRDWKAGQYWCRFDQEWYELKERKISISRPKEDWGLTLIENPDHILCIATESYAGNELYRFCLLPGHEIQAILELIPAQQQTIDAMIDLI
jgi:hypothetical protein